jgi:hypothetical protein
MNKLLIVVALMALAWPAFGDKLPVDGTYNARVRTDSGSYSVPVDVESGEVTHIRWPNGRMRVGGADIDGDEAIGTNSRGERVRIELEDLEFDDSDASDDE